MNFLHAIATRFSPEAEPSRLEERRGTLPSLLIRRHVAQNPALGQRCDEILDLASALESRGAEVGRNPEVYPAAVALLFAKGGLLEGLLCRLRLQAEPSSLEDRRGLPDGYLRLPRRPPGVFQSVGGELTPVPDAVGHSSLAGLMVYLPRPRLFADLVPGELYPDVPCSMPSEALVGLVDAGLRLVQAYSPALYDDLVRAVVAVALTTEFHHQRWSFNLRLRYLGGIFINPFGLNRLGMAEGLIHEYYHQRIWLWWFHEPLEGLPGEFVTVRSPVTGRDKPVPVMTHALVIYAALSLFYAEITRGECALTAEERAWGRERLRILREGVEPLYGALRSAVPPSSRAMGLLDLIWALYDEGPDAA